MGAHKIRESEVLRPLDGIQLQPAGASARPRKRLNPVAPVERPDLLAPTTRPSSPVPTPFPSDYWLG